MKEQITFAAIRVVLWLMRQLPYRWRVPFAGWVMAQVVAPIAGYRRRVRENLALVLPDLPEAEVRRLSRAVPDNFGRTMAELFSPEDYIPIARASPIHGPGLAALEAAQAVGRPVIMVSGHFGNYDVVRVALMPRGFRIGGLYRPLNIRRFNEIYVAAMERIGTPMFERGRRGMAEMIKFLRQGNTLAALIDQRMGNGAPLTFFDQTAWTALSIADLALKYDAVLLPCYGIRQADGMTFEVVMEAPVPHTTAEEMTQALNDSLEAQVRAHMDQWLWIHNRWKDIAPPEEE